MIIAIAASIHTTRRGVSQLLHIGSERNINVFLQQRNMVLLEKMLCLKCAHCSNVYPGEYKERRAIDEAWNKVYNPGACTFNQAEMNDSSFRTWFHFFNIQKQSIKQNARKSTRPARG